MAMASAMASAQTLPSHSLSIFSHDRPSSSCSRTIHTMMRVPLNVGCPPQIFESATMCRPSSMRVRCPLVFAFMPMLPDYAPGGKRLQAAHSPRKNARNTKNLTTDGHRWTQIKPSPVLTDILSASVGESDATLAHRMGEGLGVRAFG